MEDTLNLISLILGVIIIIGIYVVTDESKYKKDKVPFSKRLQ